MSNIYQHIEKIAVEAGLYVMGKDGVLGILADRETISNDRILSLTADDVEELYNSFIGPAIDGIEDALQ